MADEAAAGVGGFAGRKTEGRQAAVATMAITRTTWSVSPRTGFTRDATWAFVSFFLAV